MEAPAGGPPREPWDRRAGESARAYEAFRRFRELGPLRRWEALVDADTEARTVLRWYRRQDWRDRAAAWDAECYRVEDAARLEALREMHDRHGKAGRAVMMKALAALSRVEPRDVPPYAAARLLELGARLERDTLTVSVAELQGLPPVAAEDPWEAVARELDEMPRD